jgi:hypothetical protein
MRDTRIVTMLLGGGALAFAARVLLSDGMQGGGDSLRHYQIARYAPAHPELFLDQWGKPLFTLLMSPVAQLGLTAVALANVALLVLTAWLGWRLAVALAVPGAWAVPVLTLCAPVLLQNGVSALTEPMAAAWLAAGLLLLTRERWVAGGMLLSFLPFVRSEGFVVLAVVGLWALRERRWRLAAACAVGPAVFNAVGWLWSDEALWILSSNPYVRAAPQFYGRGSLLHFVVQAPSIFGLMAVAAIAGTFVRPDAEDGARTRFWRWVMAGVPAAYLGAHSLLWWQGWMGSYGLTRVMLVNVVPVALLALRALGSVAWAPRWRAALVGSAPLLALMPAGFAPVKLQPHQQLGTEVSSWVAGALPESATLFVADPIVPLLAGRDPYDPRAARALWDWQDARRGDWVLWDSHFGAHDYGVASAELDRDASLRKVREWVPTVPIPTIGGRPLEFRLYERVGLADPGGP